jgi:hypothetical protein
MVLNVMCLVIYILKLGVKVGDVVLMVGPSDFSDADYDVVACINI